MTGRRRAVFSLVPLAILFLPLAVYWADQTTSSDEVARNVTVAGVPVGGLPEADAVLSVQVHEQALKQSTGVFTVNGQPFKLSPSAIGLTANTQGAVHDAMRARRDSNPIENFLSWVASFGSVLDVPLEIHFSDDAIEAQIDGWEAEAIPNPAFEGSVEVVDGSIVAEYPQEGEKIDRSSAREAIISEMSTLDKHGQR